MLHPRSELHYRHVVPDEWGPLFELRETFAVLARTEPWHSVVSPARYLSELRDRTEPAQARTFYIDWTNHNLRIGTPGDRRCCTALYAVEAWGGDMLPVHEQHWDAFRAAAQGHDLVFGYTLQLTERMASWGLRSALYPLGWCPEAVGYPRWGTPKFERMVWWGSMTGRRRVIVPVLAEHIGHYLTNLSGAYGRRLIGCLDNAEIVLHVAHTHGATFPQWRLWQILPTSAGLIAEVSPGMDCWPLRPEHFCAIGFSEEPEDMVTKGQWLRRLCEEEDGLSDGKLTGPAQREVLLGQAARRFDELGHYTVSHCVNEYLVPASQAAFERRQAGEYR